MEKFLYFWSTNKHEVLIIFGKKNLNIKKKQTITKIRIMVYIVGMNKL